MQDGELNVPWDYEQLLILLKHIFNAIAYAIKDIQICKILLVTRSSYRSSNRFVGKRCSFSRIHVKGVEKYRIKQPGPEVIKLFSCSTQLSIKFFLLINVKMPTIVGILRFMSRKNSILSLSEPAKC